MFHLIGYQSDVVCSLLYSNWYITINDYCQTLINDATFRYWTHSFLSKSRKLKQYFYFLGWQMWWSLHLKSLEKLTSLISQLSCQLTNTIKYLYFGQQSALCLINKDLIATVHLAAENCKINTYIPQLALSCSWILLASSTWQCLVSRATHQPKLKKADELVKNWTDTKHIFYLSVRQHLKYHCKLARALRMQQAY